MICPPLGPSFKNSISLDRENERLCLHRSVQQLDQAEMSQRLMDSVDDRRTPLDRRLEGRSQRKQAEIGAWELDDERLRRGTSPKPRGSM